jgi:hypothetical protein
MPFGESRPQSALAVGLCALPASFPARASSRFEYPQTTTPEVSFFLPWLSNRSHALRYKDFFGKVLPKEDVRSLIQVGALTIIHLKRLAI